MGFGGSHVRLCERSMGMKSPWHPHRRKGRDGRQRTRDHPARFDGMRLCRERGPVAPHDATLPMSDERGRNIGDGKNDHRTGPVSHNASVTVSRQITPSPTYRPVMPASYLLRGCRVRTPWPLSDG